MMQHRTPRGLHSEISRRRFMSVAGGGVAGALLSASPAALSAPSSRPNILVIVAEDMAPSLSCYGDKQVATPHLDKLADAGVRFETAWVTQASCSPSRASLLTGLYPHQNGQVGLSHYGYRMPRGLPNLARSLRAAGYVTGIIGKLHVEPSADFPFDYRGLRHTETRHVKRVRDDAGRFLEHAAGRPFFLYLNLMDVHAPFKAQVDGVPARPTRPEDMRPWPFIGFDHLELRRRMADYYNGVRRVDAAVGLLRDLLRRRGLERQTLVVFLGDHGPAFCRAKLSCYDAGLRVPLLITWPGRIPRGCSFRAPISTVDLFPTLLAAAGATVPTGLPGEDLVPLVSGGRAADERPVFGEYTAHGPANYYPRRTVRDGRWHLILNLLAADTKRPGGGAVDGCPALRLSRTDACKDPGVRAAWERYSRPPRLELYDLRNDLGELRNLAGDPEFKAVRDRLLACLEAWRRQTRDPLIDPKYLRVFTEFHDKVRRRAHEGVIEQKRLGKAVTPRLRRRLLRIPADAWERLRDSAR
ncbi:MAG: sulfatase [Kiritimatiellaeota bacterium]|nr:sulfatase [Kiritimatiellota bacterium]